LWKKTAIPNMKKACSPDISQEILRNTSKNLSG